jgi:hypothetical protein
VVTLRFSQLSPGGQLILRRLNKRPLLLSRLGPLLASVDGIEGLGLIERFAPGRSPARNSIRITAAGRQLLQKETL